MSIKLNSSNPLTGFFVSCYCNVIIPLNCDNWYHAAYCLFASHFVLKLCNRSLIDLRLHKFSCAYNYAFWTRALLKGLTLKICVWCIFCFVFAYGLILFIWLQEGFMYYKSFEICICWWEFHLPEVIRCTWQDIKIQLLTHFLCRTCTSCKNYATSKLFTDWLVLLWLTVACKCQLWLVQLDNLCLERLVSPENSFMATSLTATYGAKPWR